jgi:hypothetical protein
MPFSPSVEPTFNYDNTDVVKSLNTPESSDSMLTSGLFGDDVDELVVPDGRGSKPLYRMRRNLKILTAFYHHVCRSKQGSVNITSAKLALYNDFRTKEYDPNSQVVPWTVKLPGAVDLLATGARRRSTKCPDYKPFKDEAY